MDDVRRLAQFIPRLRRYARVLAGDAASADDLVQDTLERALEKLHLYRAGTDLRAWLFTMMHNLRVDKLRATGAVEVLGVLGAQMPEREQRAPQDDALLMRDLDRAVARLPEEQRAVLLLVTLEGMSYGEVAGALAIPVGTVMSRLCRARTKLRAALLVQAKPRSAEAGLPDRQVRRS